MTLQTVYEPSSSAQAQPSHPLRSAFSRGNRWQTRMFLFCFLFGLSMLANLQLTNDGGWYWYAVDFLNGRRLYADMHLALQPLFVLETAAFLKVLGPGWLASKVPGVLHLFAYCLVLLLLGKKSNLSDLRKAIVAGGAFFISICSIAYQFDDYHTPADCLVLYSLLLLLSLQDATTIKKSFALNGILGVLSGFAITLRINDGLALWFGVALCIIALAPVKRFLSAAFFTITTASVVVLVVRCTGDTFQTYLRYTLFRAVSAKGGGGRVLHYPLRLPYTTAHYLVFSVPTELVLILAVFVFAASWGYLISSAARKQPSHTAAKLSLGILIAAFALWSIIFHLMRWNIVLSTGTLSVFAIYGLGIYTFLLYVRWELSGRAIPWDGRNLLLIIPFGQLISTAASSGGVPWGVYEPWAMFLIILPIASPVRFRDARIKATLIAVTAVLLIYGAVFRFVKPYVWHSTSARMMFVGRQWYKHPVYGRMIIPTATLNFIDSVCEHIGPPAPDRELLSLPEPYANYFCHIPPWHGYVQTYFDTSTPDDIAHLMDELQTAPPKWILYQRQLTSLYQHEVQYNQGRPLPHRYLDQFIERKISEGTWSAVYTNPFENTAQQSNEWILIRTRP
jgi:hypothetical protein